MSADSELILLAVNLAVNLFLFGLVIAGSVAVSFRLMENAPPRLRYVVTVTAFIIAAFVPLAVTLNGSTSLETLTEARQISSANSFTDSFVNQTFVATPEIITSASNPEPEKTSVDFLNNLTAVIADSFVGIVLFSLWILGSICFLFRDIVSHRRLAKARQGWRPATNSERGELFFPDGIPLYFGEESPATIGLFRSIIVLPNRFPDDLPLASKRFIVRHELAHAGWRDPLVNFLLRLIRALFWVSPALWMLERIAVNERESAADQAAIAKCSENESEYEETALIYAMTLVSMAKHFNSYARRDSLGANTIGLYNGSILENRVRRLLAHSTKTTNLRTFLAAMIFAGSFAGLFFMPIAFQAEEIKAETQAAVVDNQEAEKLPRSENTNDLQFQNRQNGPPQVIEFSGNNEKKLKAGILNQNANKPGHSLTTETENDQIPRVIMVKRKSSESSDDDGSSESLMRKLSEEDAKASGLNQKLDELSDKVQGLDAARKNLESNIPQVRQKAASQIDSLMRQIQTVNDSGRQSN